MVASDGVTTRSDDPADDSFWRQPAIPPAGGPEAPPADPPGGPGAPPAPTFPGPPSVDRHQVVRPAGPPPPAPSANYPGPPRNPVPSPQWQPPVYVQPAPPRPLPAQDVPALEAAEGSARTLTYGVGLIAGAVLLVVMCLLCSRLLF